MTEQPRAAFGVPPAPLSGHRPAAGDLLRTIAGLLLAGLLAPILFGLALLVEARPGPLREVIGLLALAVFLGGPISMGAALVMGLPAIYLARQLHLTSIWIFALAGLVLALGCTAWLARDDVKGWLDWVPFASLSAIAGAASGVVCWWVSERPRQERASSQEPSAGRDGMTR